jgi:hypothetical protein
MLHNIQRCTSTQPYFKQMVPSRSQSNLIYEVSSVLPDDLLGEYTCSCPGFRFHGSCAHQEMAWWDRCLWDEDLGPEEQTQDQKDTGRCPRCGQETYSETIDD